MVEQVQSDYRQAPMDAATLAALDFAVKLTASPGATSRDDVESLRSHGYEDQAIHDLVQVVAYFNYVNRVADGLGVDLEHGMTPKG